MDDQMMPAAQPQMIGTPGPGQMISAQGVAAPQSIGDSAGVQMLMQALLKQRRDKLLKGKLPGTTSQSIGMGTAGADMATGPQAPQGVVGADLGPQHG